MDRGVLVQKVMRFVLVVRCWSDDGFGFDVLRG